MGRLGTWELIVIVLGLLLLFGAKRIPEIARSLGQALNQFKRGMKDASLEDSEDPGRVEDGRGRESGSRPESGREADTGGRNRGEGEDR
jgi:sec-independent protein translocase protein TatA